MFLSLEFFLLVESLKIETSLLKVFIMSSLILNFLTFEILKIFWVQILWEQTLRLKRNFLLSEPIAPINHLQLTNPTSKLFLFDFFSFISSVHFRYLWPLDRRRVSLISCRALVILDIWEIFTREENLSRLENVTKDSKRKTPLGNYTSTYKKKTGAHMLKDW